MAKTLASEQRDEGDHGLRPGARRLRLHEGQRRRADDADAKLTQSYTGTNQITRIVTGRSLLLSG
jgi:alkylation response protein AidB-like acyl-CoA dehydrogenase